MPTRILLVDDDAGVRRSLARGLRRAHLEVVTAADGGEAIALLESRSFDIVVSDLRMPGVDGMQLLRFARARQRSLPFILFSAYATDEIVAEALREGADEFLPKPIDPKTLVARVERALAPGVDGSLMGFVAGGAWFEEFSDRVQRIAASNATVLIEGETGTGKSLVANAIWRLSPRSRGPFVVVNCPAIPEHLLESELFGHVRGSFTGATSSRIGRVHQADGGVLFLDEVGELQPDLQAKLLHLLQESSFQPVGANRDIKVNVRFISATNRDLRRAVEEGAFRRDLYYRLNVVSIVIPPLRQRPDDVPLLVDHLRRRWERSTGIPAPTFGRDALERLGQHAWPGNVRELQNLVERAAIAVRAGAIVSAQAIERHQLLTSGERAGRPEDDALEPIAAYGDLDTLLGSVSLADAVRDFERQMIESALRRADGNRSEAARLLGMNRTTLIGKLKRLEIEPGH